MPTHDPGPPKRLFLSYAHADREFAKRLALALNEAGEDVWWDEWEIQAGDSLVQKIFYEGLSNAGAFIIVLSPESTESRWVKDELDAATVRRIDGVTRVIPVIAADTPIPAALRTLLWVDMRTNFDDGVRRILNAVRGISSKPARSADTRPAVASIASVSGLSKAASAVGMSLLSRSTDGSEVEPAVTGKALTEEIDLSPVEVNDAVDELEERGCIVVRRAIGTGPFSFLLVEPTYVLYSEFKTHLDYDPTQDVKIVGAAVAARRSISARDLQEQTGLSPGRLNRAVDYLREYGLARVHRHLGTAPFRFGTIEATRKTRQLANDSPHNHD